MQPARMRVALLSACIFYWAAFSGLGHRGENESAGTHTGQTGANPHAAAPSSSSGTPLTLTSPEELRELVRQGGVRVQDGVPLLFHQSHKSRGSLKPRYKQWMQTWNSMYRSEEGWRHVFWTDEDNDRLVAETLPWFLGTFRSYPHFIQKADMARIAVLRAYGGVYADIDYECLAPSCLRSATRRNCSINLMQGPNRDIDGLFQNTLMTAKLLPEAERFWDATLHIAVNETQNTSSRAWWGGVGAGSVLTSTGPGLLTRSYAHAKGVDISAARGVMHSYDGAALERLVGEVPLNHAPVCVLQEPVFSGQVSGPSPGLVSVHHNTKSWVKDVHSRSVYLPRVLPSVLAISTPVFLCSHPCAAAAFATLFCLSAGFPSNPGEVVLAVASVAAAAAAALTPQARQWAAQHEQQAGVVYLVTSVVMYLIFR